MSMASVKTPTVSVVVPANGAGQTIRRAMESMLNQSLRDMELIVAHDGTDDQATNVIDTLASRDFRVIPLLVEGSGPAEATNAAIDAARGTYLVFLDPRGWVAPGMLASMVDMARRASLELVVSGVCVDTPTEDGQVESLFFSCPERFFPTQHDFRAAAWQLFDANLMMPLCNKLFLRERVDRLGLRVGEGLAGGASFSLGYLANVERVAVTDRVWWHFVRPERRMAQGALVPYAYGAHVLEHHLLQDLYHGWGLDGDPASMDMLQRRYLERLIGDIEEVCAPGCTLPSQEKRRIIEDMISTDHAKVAASVAHPRSRLARAMLSPIRSGNVGLVYSEGRFMSFVRRHSPLGQETFDLFL